MITITGQRYRTFYPQTDVSWGANLLSTGLSNNFSFSFSGSSGVCNVFNFSGNKIISPDNRLIGSYFVNQSLYFSGNVGTQTADLYLNSSPLYLGLPVKNNQVLSGVYLNSNNGAPINLVNLTVNGKTTAPYSTSSSYNLSYGQSFVSVNFINSGNYPVVIFSGSSTNRNYVITGSFPLLSVSPGGTGIFNLVNTGLFDLSTSTQTIPITLYTNLGNLTGAVNSTAAQVPLNVSFINLSPELVLLPAGGKNVVTLVLENNNSSSLNLSLTYVGGYTGIVYAPNQVVAPYTENITGTITGAGYLQEYVYNPSTGVGLPPYYVTQYNTGTSAYELGAASGILTSNLIIAPDIAVSSNVEFFSYGIGNLYSGFSGTVLGSAIVTGVLSSGYINYATGGILTGVIKSGITGYSNFYGQSLTGISIYPQTGYTTFYPKNKIYLPAALSSSKYSQQLFSSSNSAYITGNFSGIWSTTGLAIATGSFGQGASTGTTQVVVPITGLYSYTIDSQSQLGQYSFINIPVDNFIQSGAVISQTPLSNNLLINNNSFTVSPWKENIVSNNSISQQIITTGLPDPFGGMNATQFVSLETFFGFYQQIALTSGTKYTFSIYVKYISGDSRFYFGRDGYDSVYDLSTQKGIDLSNGTFSSITPIGNNWFSLSSSWSEKNTGELAAVNAYSYTTGSVFQIYAAHLSPYSLLFSPVDQYVTGLYTQTFNPIGTYKFNNIYTGYFYNPSDTGLYFNLSTTSVVTGTNLVSFQDTATGYVVSPDIVTPYLSTINSNYYSEQLQIYNITTPMLASLNYNIYGTILSAKISKQINGTTTSGYYSEVNNNYITNTNIYTGNFSSGYCIDYNGNTYLTNSNTGSFSFNGNITGSYSGLLASSITGTWAVFGNLTGTVYQYQGIRTYTGNWNLASGETVGKVNYLANSGFKSYNSILGTGIGYKYPYVSQLLVGYNDMFSVSMNNAGLDGYIPGYDIVRLTITGANFMGLNSGSGLSILLTGVGAIRV